MKKNISLILISLIVIIVTSCKIDDSSTDPTKDPTKDPAPQYYVTFKAGGTTVTETEASATRGTTSTPRTLTIVGTGKSGAAPKFKFYMEETFIGFTKGLNVGNGALTYPSFYIEFTNSASVLYSTKNDNDGIGLFISDISYTNGGIVSGTFSGSIKTAAGAAIQITEGKFNVKCSN
jgi:hypothetical protein